MTEDSYKQALQTAREERSKLLHERAKIDQQILKLEKIIESLRPLCDEQNDDFGVSGFPRSLSDYSFADACRIVLRTSPQFLSPTTVRDILVREGYDLSTQSNPLASVHAILKRMKASGEADDQTIDGKTLYRYKGEPSFKDVFTKKMQRRGAKDIANMHRR